MAVLAPLYLGGNDVLSPLAVFIFAPSFRYGYPNPLAGNCCFYAAGLECIDFHRRCCTSRDLLVVLVIFPRVRLPLPDYGDCIVVGGFYWVLGMTLIPSPKKWLDFPAVELEFVPPNPKEMKAFLCLCFGLGTISLATLYYQQSWVKLIRLSLVGAGAIAGCKLLYDYRTPSRLEQERKRIEREKMALEASKDATEQRINLDLKSATEQIQQRYTELQRQQQQQLDEFLQKQRLLERRTDDLDARERSLFNQELESSKVWEAKLEQLSLKEQKLETDYQQLRQQAISEAEAKAEAIVSSAERLAIQQIEDIKQLLEQQADDFRMQLELKEEFINQLKLRLTELTGIKLFDPKFGYPGFLGNHVIQVLAEFEAPCDAHDAHQFPDGTIHLWLTPRPEIRIRKVRELAEELQLRLGLLDTPDITVHEDTLELVLSPNDRTKVTQGDEKEPVVASFGKWFSEAVRISNHHFIPGDTGSGKSELVNNIAALALRELGADTEIVLIDPKFPDTEWVINGNKVRPQYIGLSPIEVDNVQYPTAYDGIFAMQDDMEQRLESAAIATLREQPLPKRKPRLYIVDEVPYLIDQAQDKNKVVAAILSVLRVGRSSKVKVLILGQDPGCKAYGFPTTATLKNFSCYYLREFALKGIDDVVPTSIEKNRLKKAVGGRLKEVASDPLKQYFALVKFPGRAAFIGELPPPKAYDAEVSNPSLQPALYPTLETLVEDAKNRPFGEDDGRICPSCSSSQVVKNGNRQGVQRFKCKACNFQFQEDE